LINFGNLGYMCLVQITQKILKV